MLQKPDDTMLKVHYKQIAKLVVAAGLPKPSKDCSVACRWALNHDQLPMQILQSAAFV